MALASIALAALPAAAAHAERAEQPWPPADGPGQLFAHFGEEHWNDDDSDITLTRVVAETARYRPDLVTTSGDKANDGTVEQLTEWKRIMSRFDVAGVPYLAGIGNHDRTSPPGVLPGTAGLLTPGVQGSLANYKSMFADRPFPFGDARPYEGIGPARPESDPEGASSHYFADAGDARWIFLDNSCWGLSDCDPVQSPDFPDADGIEGQLEFLERKAGEATDAGRVVFVVMHIPTRDPRDQSQIEGTSFNHVMGKGISPTQNPDNERFERVAEAAGVDGVFVGHIKGQWTYRGRGEIPYYIDGGAGGELYTDGPLGTDHGYWHGFRLVRVDDGRITTDAVPILDPGGIAISGPDVLRRRQTARFEALGSQHKEVGESIELELRDPDPIPRMESGPLQGLAGFATGDGLMLAPPALLVALLALQALAPRRRRRIAFAGATALIAVGGLGAVAVAQQDIPTSTPKESLPNPARIWTSSDRFVLKPVRSPTEDPRANRSQTHDGGFRARCPGREQVTVTSGFEQSSHQVVVPSRKGKIAGKISIRRRGVRVRLRQRAEVIVRVKRGKRVVRTVRRGCFGAGKVRAHWSGRVERRGKLRRARPGTYRLQALVRSDRTPVHEARKVRIG